MNKDNRTSRRSFLSSTAALAGGLSLCRSVHAAGSDQFKIALVGSGFRGTGAAADSMRVAKHIKLVAIADAFEYRAQNARKALEAFSADQVDVPDDRLFVGLDAYKKAIACDVDLIVQATSPGFRPLHYRAAIEAGKHIFMEKPGAVDPVGIRSLMASAELADKKGLSIVVGTQQRWQPQYLELIKRVHDGKLGDIVGGQAYWNWGDSMWHFQHRQPGWSDMEWQIRCWPYFVWLSGDHIVEQHLHNMDIINWAIGSPPIQCLGMGGRQCRTGPEFGNTYDHFTVEYEYANGIRVMSMCSQIKGSTPRVGERVLCTKGAICTNRGEGYIEDVKGNRIFKYEDEIHSGEIAQCANLIRSIREGKSINECKRLAESTMTVILGRLSAYTGRALKWDWAMKASKLDLSPEKYELGDLPVRPVSMPGKTKLI